MSLSNISGGFKPLSLMVPRYSDWRGNFSLYYSKSYASAAWPGMEHTTSDGKWLVHVRLAIGYPSVI